MLMKENRAIGNDPGEVHNCWCDLSLHGWKFKEAERRKEGEAPIDSPLFVAANVTAPSFVKVPCFTIHHWEHWDLKRKIKYSADANWRVHTDKYENRGEKKESLVAMTTNLVQMIGATDWLFPEAPAPLVPFIREVQAGPIKQHQMKSECLATATKDEIHALDKEHERGNERFFGLAARKYGLPNDGKLEYEGRKDESEAICRALCRLTGHPEYEHYLDLVILAQKRDCPGFTAKVDDMTDAMLLALQHCVVEDERRQKAFDNGEGAVAAEEHEPQRVVEQEFTIDSVEKFVPFDPADDDNLEKIIAARKRRVSGAAKKAKKPAVTKPATAKKRAPTPKKKKKQKKPSSSSSGSMSECDGKILDLTDEVAELARDNADKKGPAGKKRKRVAIVADVPSDQEEEWI